MTGLARDLQFAANVAMTARPAIVRAASANRAARLSSVAARFGAASQELLRSRALLRRTDTKFLVPEERLVWILAGLSNDYRLLWHGDDYAAGYLNLYFDTLDLRCFHDHRRGRGTRHKVRFRHYLDRELSFLEVKAKRPGGVTDKHRLPRRFGDETFGEPERAFVREHCDLPAEQLVPAFAISFSRMTLVGEHTEERITLDLDLEVEGGRARDRLAGVAILEVKQRHFGRRTPIMRALRAHGLHGSSASKYCIAVSLTRPGVRHNRLAPMLRAVNRIRT